MLLTRDLFGGMRLVILEWEKTQKASLDVQLQFFLEIAENIPENTIVLLALHEADKRTTLYKNLVKIAKEVKFFESEKTPEGVEDTIRQKYGTHMTRGAISLLARYKSYKLEKIFPEIEKLLITLDIIEEKHIEKFLIPELDESIFHLVNALLAHDKRSVLKNFEILKENTSAFPLYHGIL